MHTKSPQTSKIFASYPVDMEQEEAFVTSGVEARHGMRFWVCRTSGSWVFLAAQKVEPRSGSKVAAFRSARIASWEEVVNPGGRGCLQTKNQYEEVYQASAQDCPRSCLCGVG